MVLQKTRCTWPMVIALAAVLGWVSVAGAGILDSLKNQLASVREDFQTAEQPAPIDSLIDDAALDGNEDGTLAVDAQSVGQGQNVEDGDYAKLPDAADPTDKTLDEIEDLFDGGPQLPMIPEPSTLILLLLALLTIYLWRRKW